MPSPPKPPRKPPPPRGSSQTVPTGQIPPMFRASQAIHVPDADDTLDQPIDLSEIEKLSLPPEALEPDVDDVVMSWDAVLDETSYLALLRLELHGDALPTDDEVKRAFHGFALAFHPDRYRSATDEVRAAANRVYCRGAEAYRVLQDPLLRAHYVRQLASGTLRMAAEEISQSSRSSGAPTERDSIEDLVRSSAAMPFAVRADELIAAGDLKQARLQLQLAAMKDGGSNARLDERMRQLDEALKKREK